MLETVESKNQAVSKLEALIERGRSRAANVIDHVMRNQPTDRLARGETLQFRAADNLPEILMTVPDREHGIIEQSLHRNAVYQMAQATDMPVKFIDSLQSVAEPWGRQLLAHNLQTVFNRRFQKKNYLLRSLQQEVRGFLSDSYRRIDSRPVVEAKGAHFLFPEARTVFDAGAETSTAIRLSADGRVEDSASNDKCAGGAGILLDTTSAMLRIPLAELGAESLKATNAETISNKCAVFAESEVVSLVHRDPPVPIPNILAGIHQSMVARLFVLAQRVGMEPEVVMAGGVSKNIGIIRAMEAKLGMPVLVPEEPQIVVALGAALIAQRG
ncbi:MAG TPA: acyl-CoA dehydratase activase [Terriglobales bacterium]|nr:acyl-CoA dehydratase activase [Terriglobales bacterium]